MKKIFISIVLLLSVCNLIGNTNCNSDTFIHPDSLGRQFLVFSLEFEYLSTQLSETSKEILDKYGSYIASYLKNNSAVGVSPDANIYAWSCVDEFDIDENIEIKRILIVINYLSEKYNIDTRRFRIAYNGKKERNNVIPKCNEVKSKVIFKGFYLPVSSLKGW